MKYIPIFLLALTILFTAFRFVLPDIVPRTLNRDEAALAYNAFLLEKTGTDEWQQPWPITLKSFGDYKLPGYVLTLVALFKVFGHSDFIVKLPSLLAGLVVVIISSVFATKYWKLTGYLKCVPAFFASITPLFFFYSRIAFEAHVALALVLTSITLWWSSTEKVSVQKQLLLAAGATISYAVACLTYNTPLLLAPFLAVSTIWYLGLRNWKTWLPLVTSIVGVAMIVALQLLPLTKQKSAITIFADPTLHDEWIRTRETLPAWSRPILGKKPVYLATVLVKNTVNSLTPPFLIQKGGAHPWHQVPGAAHLTWGLYILALVGAVAVFLNKKENKAVLALAVGSLAPAVVTTDAPHSTRSLLFIWVVVMLAVRGFVVVTTLLHKKFSTKHATRYYSASILAILTVLSIEFVIYQQFYWLSYPQASAVSLKAGFDSKLQELEKQPVTNVAIVDPEGYHYILAAWYTKMEPSRFYATQVRQLPNSIGFQYGEKVGKYHFIAHPEDRSPNEEALLQWNSDHWEVSN